MQITLTLLAEGGIIYLMIMCSLYKYSIIIIMKIIIVIIIIIVISVECYRNVIGIIATSYIYKNSQIVKGEALSAPQRRKGSQEKKSTLELVPPIVPITAAAFPLWTVTDRRCSR